MDTRSALLIGTTVHRDIDAGTFLVNHTDRVFPADLSVYEGTAVRPSTSEAAAAIRADRAARKAANFAKRNPGRAGEAFGWLLAVLVLTGVILTAVALARNDNSAVEPEAKPVKPDNKFISLDTGMHRSVSILIDPKSGHRWLIVGETGTAMIQLQPEEFPE